MCSDRAGRRAGDAPGLKRRSGGRLYWAASARAAALGYEPRLVALHAVDDDGAAERCRALQAQMQAWMAERVGAARPVRPLDLNGLIRAYRTRPASPYHGVKWNTRRTYDKTLDLIERAVGRTAVAAITLDDLVRWYDAARWPEGRAGGVDRLRTAHGLVAMLRRLFRFGVAAEIEGCARLAAIMANYGFEAPKRRETAMTLAHAEAVIAAARAATGPERRSIALATALLFEVGLRPRDVIGEWEPLPAGVSAASPYVLNGRQWVNGLTWAHVSPDWRLQKRTTKTGAVVVVDLTLAPLALAELQAVPEDKRFGPLVLDERTERPYAEHRFALAWREVADAAGVPRSIRAADARSGAATEADVAGARLDDTRRLLGHTRPETTARYVRGDALEPVRRVATLRLAHRARTREERN